MLFLGSVVLQFSSSLENFQSSFQIFSFPPLSADCSYTHIGPFEIVLGRSDDSFIEVLLRSLKFFSALSSPSSGLSSVFFYLLHYSFHLQCFYLNHFYIICITT